MPIDPWDSIFLLNENKGYGEDGQHAQELLKVSLDGLEANTIWKKDKYTKLTSEYKKKKWKKKKNKIAKLKAVRKLNKTVVYE